MPKIDDNGVIRELTEEEISAIEVMMSREENDETTE